MRSRKVQAQRKFAQGAYVPLQLPTQNNLERATQQSPIKEERSIVHPNLAAKTLLDVVSFSNIHPCENKKEKQPIVILTRLPNNEKHLMNSHPPSLTIFNFSSDTSQSEMSEDNNSPRKRKKESNISSSLKTETSRGAANHKMLAKQSTSMSSFALQTEILPGANSSTAVRPMQKRPLERQGSSSDCDDETLLMAKQKKENCVQKNSKDVDVIRSVKRTPVETQSNIEKEMTNKKDNEVGITHRVTRSMRTFKSQGAKTVSKPKGKGITKNKAMSQNRSLTCCDTQISSVSRTKETKTVAKFLGKKLLNKKKASSQNKSLTCSQTQSSSVSRTKETKTVAKFIGKKLLNKNKALSQNRSLTCSQTQSSSVKRTKVTTETNGHVSNSEGPSASQRVFLDVFPHDSPHVIELTPENIQDDNKRMMSARLTPKALASSTQDSAVENEPIIGSILQTLKLEKGNEIIDISEDSSDSVVIKEEIPSPPKTHYESTSLLHSFNKDAALEAPTYYPTEDEFDDPIAFFERIAPVAAKYGICKIVAPQSYNPKCVLDNDINFHVTNQYIGRMYNRWGPAMREMCAIKAYLASQNVHFRSPLMDHLELNLPKLHRLVQGNGGLSQVLEMKEWKRVAEEMRIRKASGHQSLDRICMKTLLPYDTLSTQERQQLLAKVENGWNKKNLKLMQSVIKPLHRQRKLLGESDSSEEEPEEDVNVAAALKEAEDCITKGRTMTLTGFKKVASNATDILLGPDKRTCSEIEKEYWRIVLLGTEHVCVNTASIDTGKCGYGFPKTDKAKHPWNLKMVSQNSGNVLRSLGMVLGATVPTLHLGMVYSTSCWHRDPHGLPWLEYMHTGPPKIWYGIPDEQSANFRKAVETLCPTSCQNKSIWLPSDITMIPPDLLRSHGVALARVEQKPREYIMVFPKAYSCSISTGYTVSESVYFANNSWLKDVEKVFQELRESCEPTIFSLEQLLMSLALDTRSKVPTLLLVRDTLAGLVAQETCYRNQLQTRGLTVVQDSGRQRGAAADSWNEEECEVCRTALLWSKVTLKGRKSAVCLKHGLRLLETPRTRGCDVSEMQLVTMLSLKQLEEAVQSLFARTTMS